MAQKICTKCKTPKDEETEFHRKRKGFSSRCKKCMSDYSKEWFNKNKEKIISHQKIYNKSTTT